MAEQGKTRSRPLSYLAGKSFVSQAALASVLDSVRKNPDVLKSGTSRSSWRGREIVFWKSSLHLDLCCSSWTLWWRMVRPGRSAMYTHWPFCGGSSRVASILPNSSTIDWELLRVSFTALYMPMKWHPVMCCVARTIEKFGLSTWHSKSLQTLLQFAFLFCCWCNKMKRKEASIRIYIYIHIYKYFRFSPQIS